MIDRGHNLAIIAKNGGANIVGSAQTEQGGLKKPKFFACQDAYRIVSFILNYFDSPSR